MYPSQHLFHGPPVPILLLTQKPSLFVPVFYVYLLFLELIDQAGLINFRPRQGYKSPFILNIYYMIAHILQITRKISASVHRHFHLYLYLLSDHPIKVRLLFKGPVEARGRDLKHIFMSDYILYIYEISKFPAYPRAIINGNATGLIHIYSKYPFSMLR